MKIDSKTLFDWWEECWPNLFQWGWDNQISTTQRAFNALAERIKAEMGRPLIIENGAFQIHLPDLCKPGEVIEVAKIPPITTIQAQRVPGELRDKVYDASKEWWLTQLGFAEPADDGEAKKIKALSNKTYEDAIKNTIFVLPDNEPTSVLNDPQAAYDKFKDNSLIGKMATATSNEYSTHHKSCALRHDGITCTCP